MVSAESVTQRHACGSAVKGVAMVGPALVITAGYDQRLILWRLEDGFESKVKLAHFQSGAIINVGDVESLSYSNGLVAVVGQGLQLFSLLLD